jgi:hypothetical protein
MVVSTLKNLSLFQVSMIGIIVGVGGFTFGKLRESRMLEKAASGDCGCGSKKEVKEAPPPDSFVILDGGCRTCKPRSAVYNPLLINPIFDPDGYQTQDLDNEAGVADPMAYSPYFGNQQIRTILRSNLGGGI